jgi:hypothetical protein
MFVIVLVVCWQVPIVYWLSPVFPLLLVSRHFLSAWFLLVLDGISIDRGEKKILINGYDLVK